MAIGDEFCVYGVLHVSSGKWYVGLTSDISKRWYAHQYHAKRTPERQARFYNALNKYGIEAFELHTLEDGLTSEQAQLAEIKWIGAKDSFVNGYNMTVGGEYYQICDEIKAKISAKNTGRKMPREAVERIRQKLMGKPLSEEHKEKLRIKSTGKKHTAESKNKIRLANAMLLKKHSKTGFPGITNAGSSFKASGYTPGKQVYLGLYKTVEEALAAQERYHQTGEVMLKRSVK